MFICIVLSSKAAAHKGVSIAKACLSESKVSGFKAHSKKEPLEIVAIPREGSNEISAMRVGVR